MSRLEQYLAYHRDSALAKDIDPAVDGLRYVCDRFELTLEQRYWVAFLYATCYSTTTTFFLCNEFPDFHTVDVARLERWWTRWRPHLIFQTDRRWCRSRNQFVACVQSYQAWVGTRSQTAHFDAHRRLTPTETYDVVFREAGAHLFTFGRFTLFLYTEMLAELAGYPVEPSGLDLRHAESSRNGLCFATGHDALMNHHTKARLSPSELTVLQGAFLDLRQRLVTDVGLHTSVWSIETTLCAFKKHCLGKRWVGYYIERMRRELETMEARVPHGVCWDVLWQFRDATYEAQYRGVSSCAALL